MPKQPVDKIEQKLLLGWGQDDEDQGQQTADAYCEWYVGKTLGWDCEDPQLIARLNETAVLYRCKGDMFEEAWIRIYEEDGYWVGRKYLVLTGQKSLYTNGADTVVATSYAHAVQVWEDRIGDDYDFSYEPWVKVDDNKNYSIGFENGPDDKPDTGETVIPPGAKIEEARDNDNGWNYEVDAPARAWADANPPMFLCSTEY